MTPTRQPQTSLRTRCLSFANDRLSFDLEPELGGKITNLVSRPSGRSWLWRNPHLKQGRPAPGRSYVKEFDTGGWDEIFPNVSVWPGANSAWKSLPLTDHGELWCRPWRARLLDRPDLAAAAELVLEQPDLPFRFQKVILVEPGEGGFEFHYELQNRTESPMPYLWCTHPLLRAEPGMRLVLPAGTKVWCEAQRNFRIPPRGGDVDWPVAILEDGTPVDLSAPADGPLGWVAKLFTEAMPEGWVELRAPNGEERLRMSFDRLSLPHLGLWLNLGGWSGTGSPPYMNFGIEPGTSRTDHLPLAVERDNAPFLAPGEVRCWRVRCEFLPPLPA